MPCYCANFYGPINCQNRVARFGDRCQLCLSTNEGTSVYDENHFWRPPKYRTNMMHAFSNNHKILVSNKHRRAFRVSDNSNNDDDSKNWDSCAVSTRTDSSDDMKGFRGGSSEHVRW